MSGHRKFSELRDQVLAWPGAADRLARARSATLEEIRLYELRHTEAVSQAELAGRLDITQSAVSKLQHADDVRVSTLRQYLDRARRAPRTHRRVRRRRTPCADPPRTR